NLYAESGQADIGAGVVGPEPDRGNAEIAQDLRPEADFAPLPGARAVGAPRLRACEVCGDARRPVAQIDERAAPFRLESLKHFGDRARAENVADDVAAVQPRRH